MITRRTALALLGSTLLPARSHAPPTASRTSCGRCIEAGKLPALAQRLPAQPAGRQSRRRWAASPASYGGAVRMLIGSQRDIRLMTINGYARLVGYDEKLNFQPDILESFDGRGRPHLHLQDPRRATNGRTASR